MRCSRLFVKPDWTAVLILLRTAFSFGDHSPPPCAEPPGSGLPDRGGEPFPFPPPLLSAKKAAVRIPSNRYHGISHRIGAKSSG